MPWCRKISSRHQSQHFSQKKHQLCTTLSKTTFVRKLSNMLLFFPVKANEWNYVFWNFSKMCIDYNHRKNVIKICVFLFWKTQRLLFQTSFHARARVQYFWNYYICEVQGLSFLWKKKIMVMRCFLMILQLYCRKVLRWTAVRGVL